MKYEYTIKNDKFNRKKIFYIVIIMVVFAIIIGGLLWFINKDNIYDKYNVYDKKKEISAILCSFIWNETIPWREHDLL